MEAIQKSVFQIRDILEQIRIRGSKPLTYGSGYYSLFSEFRIKHILINEFEILMLKILKLCSTIKKEFFARKILY
jgi:hypothetical protein